MAKRKSSISSPVVLVGAMAVILLAVRFLPPGKGKVIPVADRKPAGEMVWALRNGTTWKLSERSGKVVLINYFATWCPPCVREMPGLVRTVRALGPQGVEAIAVSLDEGGESVVGPFVGKQGIAFPVALGFGDPRTRLIESIPVTVLIDRRGRIGKIYEGMVEERDLRADLSALLAEGAAKEEGPPASRQAP